MDENELHISGIAKKSRQTFKNQRKWMEMVGGI